MNCNPTCQYLKTMIDTVSFHEPKFTFYCSKYKKDLENKNNKAIRTETCAFIEMDNLIRDFYNDFEDV